MRYIEFVTVLIFCFVIGCVDNEISVSDNSTDISDSIASVLDSIASASDSITFSSDSINSTSDSIPSTSDSINSAPIIQAIFFIPDTIMAGESCILKCNAIDSNRDNLTYTWETVGNIAGSGSSVFYTPNSCCGAPMIKLSVEDGRGGYAESLFTVPFKYD